MSILGLAHWNVRRVPSLYRCRMLYHLSMRALYGRYFEARYKAIADEIPCGAQIVDVCAGDCYLYLEHLRSKSVLYLGLDISSPLVHWAQRHGAPARQFDLCRDEIPVSQIVVMQSSLYQFVPDARSVLQRLLLAARDKVILSEPVHNLSCSLNRPLAWLSQRITGSVSGAQSFAQRFDERSLCEFMGSFDAFERAYLVPGGRDMIGVFAGRDLMCGFERIGSRCARMAGGCADGCRRDG